MVADFARLGQYVLARRRQLGMSQDEVAAAGGPSNTKLGEIERGQWQSTRIEQTLRKLDIGLFWHHGSAKSVLQGGEPNPQSEQAVKTYWSHKLQTSLFPDDDEDDEPDNLVVMPLDQNAKAKAYAQIVGTGVDPEVLAELADLRPEQVQRVIDFVRGIKAGGGS